MLQMRARLSKAFQVVIKFNVDSVYYKLPFILLFQRCIVMRQFYFSYKHIKHDYSLSRAYAVICGRFNITVNWDYLHAQNQMLWKYNINCSVARCLINVAYLTVCAFIRSWWRCTFWMTSPMTLYQHKKIDYYLIFASLKSESTWLADK